MTKAFTPPNSNYCKASNFINKRGHSQHQVNGRVHKGAFILAITDSKAPYTEAVLARAYGDSREETAYEKPGVVITLGEDHIKKVGEAAMGHLDTTIAAYTSQAWTGSAQTQTTHPTTCM